MSDLTDFLLARIAEDEDSVANRDALCCEYGIFRSDADNLAGRVLAECAAKRAIVAEHGLELWQRHPDDKDDPFLGWCLTCEKYRPGVGNSAVPDDWPCATLYDSLTMMLP